MTMSLSESSILGVGLVLLGGGGGGRREGGVELVFGLEGSSWDERGEIGFEGVWRLSLRPDSKDSRLGGGLRRRAGWMGPSSP